jgi:hypothetical protein
MSGIRHAVSFGREDAADDVPGETKRDRLATPAVKPLSPQAAGQLELPRPGMVHPVVGEPRTAPAASEVQNFPVSRRRISAPPVSS